MQALLHLYVFWLLPVTATNEENLHPAGPPRTFVPFDSNVVKLVSNETDAPYLHISIYESAKRVKLLVGARQIFSVHDIRDIKIYDMVKWESPEEDIRQCRNSGSSSGECWNFVRYLYDIHEDSLVVCGTGAYKPTCLKYKFDAEGVPKIQDKVALSGFGFIPYDSQQSLVTAKHDQDIFSATFLDKNSARPAFIRHYYGRQQVVSQNSDIAFKNPIFASADIIPEHSWGATGENDKVFLLFSEDMVEFDCRDNRRISRLGRMCAKDVGHGQLGNVVVTFQKATINCPVVKSRLPSIVHGSHLMCDPKKRWTDCVIYAIFTPQSGAFKDHMSAVCIYNVSEISTMFSKTGHFKVEEKLSPTKSVWKNFTETLPRPRPGICVNAAEAQASRRTTITLPAQTVDFVTRNPLMNYVIEPIGGKPVLIREGPTFRSIVVTEVKDFEQKVFYVMFIGTVSGTLLKAVQLVNETIVIEEIQVFPDPVPINTIKISVPFGQVYALSRVGVAQVPVATCERSKSCVDCVLARDPYCAWDNILRKCVRTSGGGTSLNTNLVQNVSKADASQCPKTDATLMNLMVIENSYVKLDCDSSSSFAVGIWEKDNVKVRSSDHLQLLPDALNIFNFSLDDEGQYRCTTTEQVFTTTYTSSIIDYQIGMRNRSEVCGEDTVENCTVLLEQQMVEGQQRTLYLYSVLPVFGIICFVFLARVIYEHFVNRSKVINTIIESQYSMTQHSTDYPESLYTPDEQATTSLRLNRSIETPNTTTSIRRKVIFKDLPKDE